MWSKKELIDKQAEFWVVLARGSTLIAACEGLRAIPADRRHVLLVDGREIEVVETSAVEDVLASR
jgi:hypothetical protein